MLCPRWLVHTAAAGALAASAAGIALLTPTPDDHDSTTLEQQLPPLPSDAAVILITVEDSAGGLTIVGAAVFPRSQREGPHCPVLRDGVLDPPMTDW